MKKLIACLLLAALVVSLCGCSLLKPRDNDLWLFNEGDSKGSREKDTEEAPDPKSETTSGETDTPSTEPMPAVTDPEKIYDNSLIGETYSEEGSYTDEFDETTNYRYHVPYLLDTTRDATSINSRIMADFGSLAEEQLNDMESGYSIGYLDILWDAYWHDSVVFLVISCNTNYDGSTFYGVYSYDFASGKEVSKDEILSMAGTDQKEFLDAMATAAGEQYLDQYGELPDEYKDEFYYNQYNWTISDENINMNLQFFLDDSGRLAVATPIASIAGANWYYHIIYPFE